MIIGEVREQEALIRLRVRGPHGRESEIEAVVDTGFTGALTLPSKAISALGLKWRSSDRGSLADGSQCFLDFYEASLVWDRKRQSVLVALSESAPLVGMALLSGFELRMEIVDQGKVAIKRLKHN